MREGEKTEFEHVQRSVRRAELYWVSRECWFLQKREDRSSCRHTTQL